VLQLKYNEEHGITPETIHKEIRSSLERMVTAYKTAAEAIELSEQEMDRTELIAMLEAEMLQAAEALEFERAARLRDRIRELQQAPELVSQTKGTDHGDRKGLSDG
jgi:excinuclease ABC subunit B